MSTSIGIDLGTTNCAVAYIDTATGRPKVIPNRERKNTTPSVIQFLDGDVIFGSEAGEAYDAGEENCAATFKREMGSDEPFCYINGKPYTSEDLSSMLLHHLKDDAEAYLGDRIGDAVITVPAYFYTKEREATERAAERAGLRLRKIIDEPNAAVLSYGLDHWRENAVIMVYDLGGGTFDVSIVHMGRKGQLRTIATRGNHRLGGRDWDSRLQSMMIQKHEEETGIEILPGSPEEVSVGCMAEAVKKKLSANNMNSVKVPFKLSGLPRTVITVTREEFERQTEDLLERTGKLCQAVMEEADLSPGDITDVLLVGGSTRMPQVSDYLLGIMGKRPIAHVNPDEAVALGAAIQLLQEEEEYCELAVVTNNGRKAVDRSNSEFRSHLTVHNEEKLENASSLSLVETTAHAMGVIAINDEKGTYYNEIIIPANHQRPVRAAKKFRFYTSPDADNELAIFVLQGDSDNPLDCQIPYKYVVSGIRHVEHGEEYGTVIRIQYSYDRNGIIHVQARQENSGQDLPVRKERVPDDMAKYGLPVSAAGRDQGMAAMSLNAGPEQRIAHKYRKVTFDSKGWVKYDRVKYHESGAEYDEPEIHIVSKGREIEFHGYNISRMDEGVRYTINASDDFEIQCNINTSTIKPHPGGHLEIRLGIISAHLDENGGYIYFGDRKIANVPSKFHLRMALKDGGNYEVAVNRMTLGRQYDETIGNLDVEFGFIHGSHHCHLLSHAYISDINMTHGLGKFSDDSSDTPTWDD